MRRTVEDLSGLSLFQGKPGVLNDTILLNSSVFSVVAERGIDIAKCLLARIVWAWWQQ
jgi:hypothetical protein